MKVRQVSLSSSAGYGKFRRIAKKLGKLFRGRVQGTVGFKFCSKIISNENDF